MLLALAMMNVALAIPVGQPVLDGAPAPVTESLSETVDPDGEQQPEAILIPRLTIVDIEILDSLNSKTSKIGDKFHLRLAQPIMINDTVVIPAGTRGEGEVIHAAKARAAGKAGEMILAARYLEFQGNQIKLRSFQYGPSAGKSNAHEAMAAGIFVAAPLTLFISGGNVDVPAGSLAHAKLAEDTQIRPVPIAGE